MSTSREDYAAAIRAQGRQARQLAAQLGSRGRALLVAELVRGVYDAVKFDHLKAGDWTAGTVPSEAAWAGCPTRR